MTDISKDKRGRPRLTDPETPMVPPMARLSSRQLNERDLEARRYAERMAKRAYRAGVRRNRHNPQNLRPGERRPQEAAGREDY